MNKAKLLTLKHILNIILIIFILVYITFIFIPNIDIDFIVIFLLGVLFYFILEPLHELGHYCIAKYYVKKKNANVQLCLSRNKTNCSNWNVFSIKEYIIILLFGSIFKIIFCTIGILSFWICKNYLLMNALLFTIFIEVIGNYQPSLLKCDMKSIFYALENHKIPDNEDTNMNTIKRDFFIRKIYPWLLIPASFAICKLEMPLLHLVEYIFNF